MIYMNWNETSKIHMLKHTIDIILKDVTSFGSLVFYLFVMIIFITIKNFEMVYQLLIGLVGIFLVSFFIKSVYFKYRPKRKRHNNFLERIDAASFPSIHSARIVFLGMSLINFFDSYLFAIFISFFVFIVCYSRVYLKKHDFIDVIGGVVLGLLMGVLIVHSY